MIEGVVASLVAALLVGGFIALRRSGLFRELLDVVLYYFKPSELRDVRKSTPRITSLQRVIVRRLLLDQSRFGYHKGQFGKSREERESKKWQNEGVHENISRKPRMYLTYWPTIVMHRHQLARRSVELARIGIQHLFSDNQVLVAQSAAPNMTPYDRPVLVSYRHSMAGALLLAEFDPWNSITHAVVDSMLDPKNDWQKESGGWRQVSGDFAGTDHWASAYAARLLTAALNPSSPFSNVARDISAQRLETTLSFLEGQWERRSWAFGKLTSEESAIPLFVDLADVLRDRNPQLAKKCLETFRLWLSPSGDISCSYKEKLNHIPEAQLYARMAYAFFLGERDSEIWRRLFEYTVKTSMEQMLSSDLAFVLDMSFTYECNCR